MGTSILAVLALTVCWFSMGLGAQTFPAYFIFGDSLVDVGNNNYINSVARANSRPYGIDFPAGPTGRFSNGKVVPDFICESLSLPFRPPYLAPTTRGQALLQGVNYASAAGGILRSSGFDFVGRVDFDTQLSWFANNVHDLNTQLGESGTAQLLSSSLFSISIGSNDYTNNYLLKGSPTSIQFTPAQYQQYLLTKFSAQLTQLFDMGARNVLVMSLGPLGCIPSQLALRSVNGECSAFVNNLASNFNTGLKSLVSNLNSKFNGSRFMYVDVFQPVLAYRTNPAKYGFKFGSTACCGAGRFNGQIVCLPVITKPCPDRLDYVFWDAFHPSEHTYKLLANLLNNLL